MQEKTRKNPWWRRVFVVLIVVVPFIALGIGISVARPSFLDLGLLFGGFILIGFGVTIGYHRYLTHRSFECHPAVKFVLLLLGTMAFEGPALEWVATHRMHHKFSDELRDPHSPWAEFVGTYTGWSLRLQGFLHSHITWMFRETAASPDVYARALKEDWMVVYFSRYFFVWSIISLLLPFAIGGISGGIWGGLVRMGLVLHTTWSINSLCHMFGSKDVESKAGDESRNLWWLWLLSLGECFHRNHHAHSTSARHGLKWWQFDMSWYVIVILARLGLVWDVNVFSLETKKLILKYPSPTPIQPKSD